MKHKVVIPETCDDCRFNVFDNDHNHECVMFERKLGDPGDYCSAKCSQCLAKPEIEIEWEE